VSSLRINICHLYPDFMNLYGDRGNIIALYRRCFWHGLEVRVHNVSLRDDMEAADYDLFFMGGGQDREQSLIFRDLLDRGPALVDAVNGGAALLAVCGGYQLLGRYYRTGTGEEMPGVGLFDAWTEAGKRRLIGNVVVRSSLAGVPRTIVGFENHSGRTYLGRGARPLGHMIRGGGNNGDDGTEGAVYRAAVGTYLHGSLLPKNAWLADWLIEQALRRRHGEVSLPRLDDALEEAAHRAAIERAKSASTSHL